MHLHSGSLERKSGFCFLDLFVLSPSKGKAENWNKQPFTALIDTGATKTCISQKVIDNLKLRQTGNHFMRTASGEIIDMPKFEISIIIPMTSPDPMLYPPRYDICPVKFNASKNWDVLLGMDILRKCHFTMSDEKFTLSA